MNDSMRWMVAGLCLSAACSSSEAPSPNPPPPWGVPISGGTLLVTRDGRHAVVADPDRDRLVTVELAAVPRVVAELELTAGDEPGRLVEDGAGRIHVALRRGGALLTVDPQLTSPVRRAACAEPRGLAWASSGDVVHLACAGGELMTFPAAGGDATRVVRLDRDLRDVVISGDELLVTRFRSAEVLTVAADGTLSSRARAPSVQRVGAALGAPPDDAAPLIDAVAAVAWRTVPLPAGGALMVHQRHLEAPLQAERGGYGRGCKGPAETALTVVRPGAAPVALRSTVTGALPVDLALSPAGDRVAVVTAGNRQVQVAPAALDEPDHDDCQDPSGMPSPTMLFADDLGAPTAVSWTPAGALIVFYPELPGLVIRSGGSLAAATTVTLPGEIGYDSGRALFHRQTASGLACATCHPEGRDDGQVWDFAQLGRRRTQSLAGGVLDRAPFHWTGDMDDLPTLMQSVFVDRMLGQPLTRSETLLFGPWLDRVPAPAPVAGDAAAVERGRALFASAALGCSSCHAGPAYSGYQRFDVGTGGVFKTPSLLGVAARTPLMHDGCAATLRDRFTACGGGDAHGVTSTLTADQLDDLLALLESL